MHFSQLAIKTWAQLAQPLFRKEEAIARNALEEGNGTKVSQLFIFMHNINVGGWGRGGGDRRGPQRRTGWGVQGGPRVASPRTSPWSTTPYPSSLLLWGGAPPSVSSGHQDPPSGVPPCNP
jgi:hypothetical protein